MSGFVHGVADAQAFIAANQDDSDYVLDELDYVLDEQRRIEARHIAGCAARWVAGELDATGSLAAARGPEFGAIGARPSLLEKLGRRLTDADQQTRDAVPAAIHATLAIGYLFMCETEGRYDLELRLDRSPEDIWEIWVLTCAAPLRKLGFPRAWAKRVAFAGSEVFVADLAKVNLTRLFGGLKHNELGILYAQAGVHLRLAHTSSISDEIFEEQARARDDWDDPQWRWGDYPFE